MVAFWPFWQPSANKLFIFIISCIYLYFCLWKIKILLLLLRPMCQLVTRGNEYQPKSGGVLKVVPCHYFRCSRYITAFFRPMPQLTFWITLLVNVKNGHQSTANCAHFQQQLFSSEILNDYHGSKMGGPETAAATGQKNGRPAERPAQ